MFGHVHRFVKRTHSFFSKSNLRLLSLLGIAFAIVITVVLTQQQQDLRQRAAESPTLPLNQCNGPTYDGTSKTTFCCGQRLCLRLAGDDKAYCDPSTRTDTKCYGNTSGDTGSGGSNSESGGGSTTGELGSFSITVENTGCTEATVTWTKSANATSYLVEAREDPSAAPLPGHTAHPDPNQAVRFINLKQGTIYTFTVTAQNGSKKKLFSKAKQVTCPSGSGDNGPSDSSTNTPGTFTFSTPTTTCNSAQLSWGASTYATGYVVRVYEGGPTGPVVQGPTTVTQRTHTVTGLKTNTIYTFTVTAVNGGNGIKTMSQTKSTNSSCGTGGGGGSPSPTTTKTPTSSPGPTRTTTIIPPTSVTTTVTNAPAGNSGTISLTLTLPGIGKASEFKNPNPKRPQRKVSAAAIGSNNTTVTSQGDLTFDSATSSYKGTVTITSLPVGNYTIKVRFDNTLWKKFPGTLVITNSDNNQTTAPSTALVSGDIDQNNSLTIIDYTNFVKCYQAKSSCTAAMGTLADFDDDGTAKGDLDDLTILQKGFKTQLQGD